jgi:lipopolysaccharide/colanic/teichoic acid biosynthesis glycosyltransferase
MSLVGPRPDIPFAVAMYQNRHWERFQVLPGITGLWQITNRKAASFEEMISLDMEYIEKQSLLLDIKILILTVLTILKGNGS